jgi:hypothetical protein
MWVVLFVAARGTAIVTMRAALSATGGFPSIASSIPVFGLYVIFLQDSRNSLCRGGRFNKKAVSSFASAEKAWVFSGK